jgi:hypothetical protein
MTRKELASLWWHMGLIGAVLVTAFALWLEHLMETPAA